MVQLIFTIHDNKAQAYLPPFFLHAAGMAKRTFADCCNDPDHAFGKHPEDYTLFQIGSFNDATCELKWDTPISSLGNGVDHIYNPEVEDSELDKLKWNESQIEMKIREQ